MQVYDTPPPDVAMIECDLSDDEWKELEDYLVDEHRMALDARGDLEKEWTENIRQWNSRMDRPDASAGDSNIDMPTSYKYGRVEAAKVLTELFREPGGLFVVRKVTKRPDIIVEPYQQMVDWIEDQSNYLKVGLEDFRDSQIFGMCVDKLGWQRNAQTVVQEFDLSDQSQSAELEVGEAKGTHKILGKYAGNKAVVEKTIVIKEGCWPQRITPPDYIWPQYAAEQETIPWQTHRAWKTKPDMEATADAGKFPREKLDDLGDPEVSRPKQWDVRYDKSTGTTVDDSVKRHYEFCETYLARKVAGHKHPVELIVYWERSKGKLLSVWYNWLKEERDPFSLWAREPNDDSLCGISLMFRLKRMHQARSGAINIRFDAARRSASTMVFMDSGATDLLRHFPGNILRDGIFPTSADLDKGIKQFRLAYDANLLENFEQVFDSESAMITGHNDTDMGKDVAERPTMRGTMKIMESVMLPVDLMRESYSEHLSDIMSKQLARYRQFLPHGMQMFLAMATDKQSAKADVELFKWPDGVIAQNVMIRTRVTSKTINKDIVKQESLTLTQTLPEIINYVLQLAQAVVPVLPNGQPNPAASVARDALIFYAEAVDDMFTKFKVPSNIKIASLVAALDLGIQEAQSGTAAQLIQAQGQLQQAQGQLQQTQGQVQQQGSQLEQLKAALEQAQAGMQQAQLEGFHLRRAFGGFSPGSESAIAGGPALTGSQAGMEGAGGTPGGPMG